MKDEFNPEEYKIENTIPMPTGRGQLHRIAELISTMNVGDSFLLPIEIRANFQQSVSHLKNSGGSKKQYTCRKTDKGHFRAWRIK